MTKRQSDEDIAWSPEQSTRLLQANSKSTRAGLIIASGIAALWSLIASFTGFTKGANAEGDVAIRFAGVLGEAAGTALAVSAMVWLVTYLAYIRPRAKGRGGPAFAIILASAVLAALVPAALIGGVILISPRSVIAERISEDWRTSWETELRELDQQRDAVIGAGIIDTARIGRTGGIADARQRLSKARELTERMLTLTAETQARARARIIEEEPDLRRRNHALSGFDDLGRQTRDEMQASADRVFAIYEKVEEQIDLLERAQGHWTIERGEIAFYRDRDLVAFNATYAEIERLVADLQAHQASVSERMNAQSPEGARP